MTIRIIVSGFAVGLLLSAAWAPAATWYVATNGNDTWSGTRRDVVGNKRNGPFASVTKALEAARNAKGSESRTILLRGGTYELAQPLSLISADSGSDAKHPLTISAYRNEKPVLSGGRRITGWTQVPGKSLWQTEVPAVREGRWYFRQLFVNGERRQRARTPTEGFFRVQGASSQDRPMKIKFKPGDIKKEWAADGDVELIGLFAWSDIRMQIRDVNETNHIATLSGNPRESNKEDNAQYYIENAPDALDAPGEWYLDRKTGILTYWPKPGEDLRKAEVIAPELQQVLNVKGDIAANKTVHDVVLRGITFSYSDWPLGTNGYADSQAAIAVHGHLLAEGAVGFAIEACTFSHLGGYGIDLGRGCQNCKIVGNELVDLAAGGIRIGETKISRESIDQNFGHIITDNHLHHLGQVYTPAVGIVILQSGTNRIAHNDIHDLYYTAISVGWTWGYRESPCRANLIEFNHLHDIGQFRLSDMGAVYTLGPQPGTIVRNNLIHDVNSFTYGGWGLYTDEGSSGIILESNVVYRCKSAGFHQHYGRENILRNNIFAFGKENQLMRTRPEPHISFIFTNNIVYFDSGNLLGSDWSNEHYVIDDNIYWRVGGSSNSMKFAGVSLDQWQARGHDEHSVIANPLFVAPENYDFRLRSGSPAFALGFKQIDLREVGVRKTRH